MATTADSPIFIDTNVLVFATIPASPRHQDAIAALHEISQSNASAWISRQVIREYLVQLTRPGVLPSPQPAAVAAGQIPALMRMYHVADETGQVTAELLHLMQSISVSGKQVHDANIVATMQAHGVPRLLTDNVADFARFSSLITVVPL